MQKNIYIKLLLTVIAVELGIMLFKDPSREVTYVAPAANPNGFLHTNYQPVLNQDPQSVMKVEIVGVNLADWNSPYNSSLPVMLCFKNYEHYTMDVADFPLQVTTK